MTEEIIVACITGGLTLIGVLASNNKHDAVIDTKIENLTTEVRKHNNFAEEIPVMKNRINYAESRIDKVEESLDNLKLGGLQ